MKKVTGGNAPAILWSDFMKKAHKGRPITSLKKDKIDISSSNFKKDKKTLKKKLIQKNEGLFDRLINNLLR
jgi:membrane peptidoglycan carboxypeptidase